MKSVLRFLAFVLVIGLIVAALYFWRALVPAPAATPVQVTTKLPSLAALDREFTTLVNQVLPSVVSISALPADAVNPRLQLLRRLFGGSPGTTPPQLGSGAIVSEQGHIVTNFHVIQGAAVAEVYLSDGRKFPARFVGADKASDVAILKIEADALHPIGWGDSDEVSVGQMVFAVGNPLGLQETVTQGIISGKGRRGGSEAANEFFQTDAAINPGNSGGPLVDLSGNIIGINNFIAAGGEGIGFAIPSNIVRRVYESIRDHGRFIRPWFGAMMQPLNPQLARQLNLPADTHGALVLATYEGSPAEKAGLVPGDVITAFNDHPIRDHIDLRNRVTASHIGENVRLTVRRSGREMPVQAVIQAEPGA